MSFELLVQQSAPPRQRCTSRLLALSDLKACKSENPEGVPYVLHQQLHAVESTTACWYMASSIRGHASLQPVFLNTLHKCFTVYCA